MLILCIIYENDVSTVTHSFVFVIKRNLFPFIYGHLYIWTWSFNACIQTVTGVIFSHISMHAFCNKWAEKYNILAISNTFPRFILHWSNNYQWQGVTWNLVPCQVSFPALTLPHYIQSICFICCTETHIWFLPCLLLFRTTRPVVVRVLFIFYWFIHLY